MANTLYYGDNLDVLRRYIADESVDLVYLDPPFQSGRDYNVLFEEKNGTEAAAQIKAFEDTWTWDQGTAAAYDEVVSAGGKVSETLAALRRILGDTPMLAYLSMMAPRLVELRRVLKQTGSLYLHCDPTASHYLKLILDAVFGPEDFLSEVAWKRTGTHSSARRWGPVHDVILYYARGDGGHVWNRPYVPLGDEHRKRHYRNTDDDGRVFAHGELTAPGTRNGRSGVAWRGFDVTSIGRHWMTTVEKLDVLDSEGRIYFPPDGGWPRLIRYEEDSKGRAIGDIWEDIPPLNMMAKERLGYPTQKPVALLERILSASSNEADVVLDPFCGCGTTIAAAQLLKRQWIGIDVTHLAIGLIKSRLLGSFGAKPGTDYQVIGEPTDLAGAQQLAQDDRHQFEHWALGLVGARASAHGKGADKGIDGVLLFQLGAVGSPHLRVLISVKSGHVGVNVVSELRGVVEREKAALGVLLTLDAPTGPMKREAASAGFYESPWRKHPKLQILTIEELLTGVEIDMPPIRPGGTTLKQAPRFEAPTKESLALPGFSPPAAGAKRRRK